MYSLPSTGFFRLDATNIEHNYQRVLSLGNGSMLTALIVILLSVFVGYIADELFSISVQVVSHIALIVFATLLKIGYVLRLIGRKGLGASVL